MSGSQPGGALRPFGSRRPARFAAVLVSASLLASLFTGIPARPVLAAPNQAPVCSDVILSTDEDVLGSTGASCTDADSDPLTYSIVAQGAKGTAGVSGSNLTYDPIADLNGVDTFTYTANDGQADSTAANVAVTINPVNDAPSFVKGANQAVGGDAGPQSVSGWATAISAGPADEAGQALDFQVTGNDNPVLFSTLPAVSASGTLTYTPANGASGIAHLTLVLHDDGGVANGGVDTSAPQQFNINVVAANHAPVCLDVVLTTNEDVAGSTAPACTDQDSDPLTFSIVAQGTQGTAGVSGSNLTYDPGADLNGADTFTYRANDGSADSTAANVGVTINSVNDAPGFTKGANQAVEVNSGAHSVPGWATAISAGPADEVGQAVNFIVTNNNNGLFSAQPAVSPTGALSFTSAPGATGSATVTVAIHDDGGTANGGVDTSAPQTFSIRVTTAPTVTLSAPADGATGVALSPTLDAVPSDVDGDTLDVTFYGRPVAGTVPPAGIVQDIGAAANTNAGETATVLSVAKTVSAGNTLVVGFAYYAAPGTESVTDNLGNTYTRIERSQYSTVMTASQWYARVTTGGALTTIIATHPAASPNVIEAVEIEAGTLAQAGGGTSGLGTSATWAAGRTIPADGLALGFTSSLAPVVHSAGPASGSPSTPVLLHRFFDGTNAALSSSFAYAEAGARPVTGFSGTTLFSGSDGFAAAGAIFNPANPWQVVGTATGVATGAHATVTWSGLDPGTEYEWYAIASDGAFAGSSATRSFTTVNAPTITLSAPADGATGVALSPTLDAVPSDVDGDALDVTFYGRPVAGTVPPAGIVQDLGAADNGTVGQTSTVLAVGDTVTAGNVIVVGFGYWAAPGSESVTDSLGNTYTRVEYAEHNGGRPTGSLWYAPVTVGGVLTSITATHPAASFNVIQALETSSSTLSAAGGGNAGDGPTATWAATKTIPANGLALGFTVTGEASGHGAGAASGTPSTPITLQQYHAGGPNLSSSFVYAQAGGTQVTGFTGTTVFTTNYFASAGAIFAPVNPWRSSWHGHQRRLGCPRHEDLAGPDRGTEYEWYAMASDGAFAGSSATRSFTTTPLSAPRTSR